MALYKRYVDVVLVQHRNGRAEPLYLCWEDGRKYRIDRILSAETRASSVGGCGVRYVCMIMGRQRNLYREQERWFLESHRP